MEDFRQGNELALKTLLELHFSALISYAGRLSKDEAAAYDIVTESFVKLWDKRAHMESLKGMIAYLYVIIRNGCFVFLQQRDRMAQSHQEASYLEQFQAEADTEETRSRLIQLILLETAAMPPQMQQVFRMAYLESMSAQAIAEALNLSVLTVHTHKKLAMKRLRAALSKKGFSGRWTFFFAA